MRWIYKTALTTFTALALAAPAAGIASAATTTDPSAVSEVELCTRKYKVAINRAPIRTAPSKTAETIRFKNQGEIVTADCKGSNGFMRVQLRQGGHGWMLRDHLDAP
jgi:hypothetical protein